MKLLIIFAAVATSALFAAGEFQSQKLKRFNAVPDLRHVPVEGRNQFYEGIFRTRLDHFRPQNQQRVNFTYHVNADFYDPDNGPIYVFLKDARDYSTRWIQEGLMLDIARETQGALMTFDYRYFGANRPTPTASMEDLEYLTIEQMLADIAHFCRFTRQYIGNGQFSPVILWGSGIGGTLAVWARSRYPHLVHAAWSSSGYIEPELASYGPYDYLEYTFFIQDEGHCISLIRNAYTVIANLVVNGYGEYLSERLNLCHPVDTTSEADVAALYDVTIRAVLSFVNEYHYVGVRSFCEDLDAIPGDPLNSLARWLRYVYGDAECFDHSYNTIIELNSNSTWGSPGTIQGTRQWYYLQCTQVGTFLLADENTWLPGTVTLDFHLQKCEDIFGSEFDYDVLRGAFNAILQEFDQAITNVVYSNGFFDPFRYFGRMYDPTAAGVVVNMDYVSKSADLASISDNDNESVFNGKTQIRELILLWSNITQRALP